ncbi:MAG TPA: ABC transporter substrate-binding protein [Alphaproteobacteria bacterium]
MKRRKFLASVATIGAAAAFNPLAAPAVRAQASAGKINLLVTTSPPDPNAHYFWWALEKGFYRDAGVDVAIQSIVADTTTVRGLLAGEGDVGWAGAGSGMQAMAAGSKLKILSSFGPRLDFLVLASKKVPNLKSLEGHPFAVSQLGAVSHTVAKLMIERAGADSKKVQWLSVGSGSSRLQALSAERVDATILNSLQAVGALRTGSLHAVGDALKDLPNFLYSWEIVTQEALRTKPAALNAFTLATSRGVKWAQDNPADAAKISQKLLPNIEPSDIADVIQTYAKNQYFDPRGGVQRADWDYTVDALVQNAGLTKPIKYDDFVVTDYTKGLTAAN